MQKKKKNIIPKVRNGKKKQKKMHAQRVKIPTLPSVYW